MLGCGRRLLERHVKYKRERGREGKQRYLPWGLHAERLSSQYRTTQAGYYSSQNGSLDMISKVKLSP
jgi:hypothetical protein